ncbi:MAG: ROK family transcriptional regulator [Sinobacteraceae bacterium]|nr:ROK family transcriptional regulator [Nevskiaceae bacterium]
MAENHKGNGSQEEGRDGGMLLSGTNLERAGDHNQRVTLHAIRVNGPITRTDLADITGLTPPAIANITKRLMQDNLIKEAGRVRGARGQPPIKLVINPDSWFSVGVNVDRDHITLVVLDFQGVVRARAAREIAFALPEAVHAFFQRSIGSLLEKASIKAAQLVGIGVAFPDDIQQAELPEQPANYATWGSVAVDRLFTGVLRVPVFVENDAAAAAMGEMQFGRGHQYQSFFYILITAALGGGLVIDGHYFRGANGRSAELGWLRAHDGFSRTRQLQNIVSLSALHGRLAAGGYRVASPRALTRLDEGGQEIVNGWIETSVEAMLETLLAINCLINPQAVLIGGRLPSGLVEELARRLNERLQPYAATMPAIAPVERALLSDDAPAVGAAILPFTHRLLPTRAALMKVSGG